MDIGQPIIAWTLCRTDLT